MATTRRGAFFLGLKGMTIAIEFECVANTDIITSHTLQRT